MFPAPTALSLTGSIDRGRRRGRSLLIDVRQESSQVAGLQVPVSISLNLEERPGCGEIGTYHS